MPFQDKIIAGDDFSARMTAEGATAFELDVAGKTRLKIGRVCCGAFSETNALLQKLRRHTAVDRLSASFEAETVLPFGCEYQISRKVEICDGFADWTLDVRALNYGLIEALSLEELFFCGPWTNVEFLIFGENAFRTVIPGSEKAELYRAEEIPWIVRLTAADGVRIEFLTGADLWRHRSARHLPGAHCEFALTGNADEIKMERNVLRFDPETSIEKRPWRFSNLIAWENPGRQLRVAPGACDDGSETRIDLAAEKVACLSSSAGRKFMRSTIRRAANNLIFENASPSLCFDAAHLGRPAKKQLEHCDADDFIHFYLWGSRQLAANGFSLQMQPAAGSLLADSVCAANLNAPLRPLNDNDEE